MFFKSRRETTIFDPFCFRGGLKPSTRVGIQGLKVLTGLHDSCSSQIDWSYDMKHVGIEIKFYNLDTFKKQIDVNFIDLDSNLVDLNYNVASLIFCHFWRSIDI